MVGDVLHLFRRQRYLLGQRQPAGNHAENLDGAGFLFLHPGATTHQSGDDTDKRFVFPCRCFCLKDCQPQARAGELRIDIEKASDLIDGDLFAFLQFFSGAYDRFDQSRNSGQA